MICIRPMAAWLAAVIVLIAVGLMPSGAQAHGGHPHAAAEVARAAPGPVALVQVALVQVALPQAALPHLAAGEARPDGNVRGAVARTVVGPTAAPARMLTAGACDGTGCGTGCRSSGSCCTGAGLAPDGADATGPRGPGDRALARALPARTDIVPEAIPEPPRFRA